MAPNRLPDPNAFAITLEQAVEYTATRIPPTKPAVGNTTSTQYRVTKTPRQRLSATSRAQHRTLTAGSNPSSGPPLKYVDPRWLSFNDPYHNTGPYAFTTTTTVQSATEQPAIPIPQPSRRHPDMIHPRQMQHIRLSNSKLYHKLLSRNLNSESPPNPSHNTTTSSSSPSTHQSPRRPKTPTHPPPISSEELSKHDTKTQLFCHRQAHAARLFDELEENGWTHWEREFVDVDAISRDFGQDSRDAAADADIQEYLQQREKIKDAIKALPTTTTDLNGLKNGLEKGGKSALPVQNAETPSKAAVKIVRYTDQDEVEEPESEDEAESYAESRLEVIKEVKRDQNKRVALFLADMIMENQRIEQMGV